MCDCSQKSLTVLLEPHTEYGPSFLPAKQKYIKLLHVSALDGGESEPVKMAETKGCSMFCVGSIQQQGGSAASAVTAVGGGNGGIMNCLCVAIKRTVQVYELVKSRQRYRKVCATSHDFFSCALSLPVCLCCPHISSVCLLFSWLFPFCVFIISPFPILLVDYDLFSPNLPVTMQCANTQMLETIYKGCALFAVCCCRVRFLASASSVQLAVSSCLFFQEIYLVVAVSRPDCSE